MVELRVLQSSRYFIHTLMDDGRGSSWTCTVVYMNPKDQLKECVEEIGLLANSIASLWLMIGDLNEIILISEKVGGATANVRKCLRFGKWEQNCGLIDLDSGGPKYTQREQERRGYKRVYERLDRGFGNHAWRLKFSEAYVKVLPRVKSDHHPILVELNSTDKRMQISSESFRFEAAWAT